MDEDENMKTVYFIKDSIQMMLVTCIRVFKMRSEGLA